MLATRTSQLASFQNSRRNSLYNCQRTEWRSPPPRVPLLLSMNVLSWKRMLVSRCLAMDYSDCGRFPHRVLVQMMGFINTLVKTSFNYTHTHTHTHEPYPGNGSQPKSDNSLPNSHTPNPTAL
jgi:hypothetical protein